MLAIPLFFFLIIYSFFVFGTVLFFLFDIYHILLAGDFSFTSIFITSIVSIGMILCLGLTWITLSSEKIDWNTNFSPFTKSVLLQDDSF
jgi:hypothetical protein